MFRGGVPRSIGDSLGNQISEVLGLRSLSSRTDRGRLAAAESRRGRACLKALALFRLAAGVPARPQKFSRLAVGSGSACYAGEVDAAYRVSVELRTPSPKIRGIAFTHGEPSRLYCEIS